MQVKTLACCDIDNRAIKPGRYMDIQDDAAEALIRRGVVEAVESAEPVKVRQPRIETAEAAPAENAAARCVKPKATRSKKK